MGHRVAEPRDGLVIPLEEEEEKKGSYLKMITK